MKFIGEDTGKLFVRCVLGILLTIKGVMFFVDGARSLMAISKFLSIVGVNFWPLWVGRVVAVIRLLFGITFLLGAFFKTSAFLLGSALLFDAACGYYLGINDYVLCLMLASVMYGFIFIGAGQYSVQK